MIKTVSDFLEELKAKGTELIKKYEIVDHPVLTGDMYEGLTQELLNRSIFDGLNLKIVGGKIKNSRGDLSGEIDCMLVEGDGDKLPYTEKYIYHFSQVIAVIEVKKSLYSNSLSDSYSTLKTVIDVSREPEKDGEKYIITALRDAWKSMLKTELPKTDELSSYTEVEQLIYHTLLMEAYFPLRIVFGYFGFKTEYSLREAFANYLGSQADINGGRGFGAGSLPSLIICGKNSIIKNNGMPFAMPFTKDEFYWNIYVTSPEHPLHNLLEIIWTRLSYKFQISSSIFGIDSDYEPVHKYITCKIDKNDKGNYGWMYNYSIFSDKILNNTSKENVPWKPHFLSEKQFIVINQLIRDEFINYETEHDFIEFITEDGENLKTFIDTLVDTGLVYNRNNEIRLLTDECLTLILPDGTYCVGENKNLEMTHWLTEHFKDKKASS